MVVLQRTPNIRCAAFAMQINTVLFLAGTYLLSLSKLKDTLGDTATTMGSILAVVGSFAHLLHQTCRVYPVNGKWIMLNFGVVGTVLFWFIEISGICSPGLFLMTKIIILHAALLTMRLMFDVNQAFGAELQ